MKTSSGPKTVNPLPFYRDSNFNWIIILILLLLLIAVNTYLSRTTVNELIELQSDISQSEEVISTLEELHVGLLTAESGQRGYLLTQDPDYLAHYEAAKQAMLALSAKAITLRSEVEGQTESIQALVSLIQAQVDNLEDNVKQADKGDFKLAVQRVRTDEGRQVYSQIHDFFESIKLKESSARDTHFKKLENTTSQANTNGFVSFITGLILAVGLYFMARLNIRNRDLYQRDIENQNVRLQQAVEERTEELSLFSAELKRSNRELEDFAFVASHDLQEPLRKIMAFGDRLLSSSSNLDDKQKDYLERMRTAAIRMSTLISDLLEFSRINTRGKPFQAVDLNTVVESCIDDLSVLIEEAEATINYEKLPIIQADPMQMRQLLFNLIANAIKFSKDTKDTQIMIKAEANNDERPIEFAELTDWFTISVIDNGIGFEQEYAEKIFAPFQRLHSRKSFKGTGIGLAICRRIVERHNGTIKASGIQGKGANFEFVLPANNRIISALDISEDDGV